MDPYDLARQQGQVMGMPGTGPEEPEDVEDLMDLLVQAYAMDGQMDGLSPQVHEAVGRFAAWANGYLGQRRVVSTGIVDGDFALVFEDGQAVPLASSEPVPERPDNVVPITTPKDSRMRGMPVRDGSVQITTGQVGSPTRKPR